MAHCSALMPASSASGRGRGERVSRHSFAWRTCDHAHVRTHATRQVEAMVPGVRNACNRCPGIARAPAGSHLQRWIRRMNRLYILLLAPVLLAGCVVRLTDYHDYHGD